MEGSLLVAPAFSVPLNSSGTQTNSKAISTTHKEEYDQDIPSDSCAEVVKIELGIPEGVKLNDIANESRRIEEQKYHTGNESKTEKEPPGNCADYE